jgi:CheY-like chemotaxis protein
MKIVVIDDSESDQRLVIECLAEIQEDFPESYPVFFQDVKEAYEEIKQNKVALIICDMNLPPTGPMAGIELLQRIRKELKREYPIILMSGCRDSLDAAARMRGMRLTKFWKKETDYSNLAKLALEFLAATRVETRVKNLEDEILQLRQDQSVGFQRLQETLDGNHKDVSQLINSDDRAWARLITSLIPKKATKWARNVTGMEPVVNVNERP